MPQEKPHVTEYKSSFTGKHYETEPLAVYNYKQDRLWIGGKEVGKDKEPDLGVDVESEIPDSELTPRQFLSRLNDLIKHVREGQDDAIVQSIIDALFTEYHALYVAAGHMDELGSDENLQSMREMFRLPAADKIPS